MPFHIKFDGIQGESQDIKGAVDVHSFVWGLSNSSPRGAAGWGSRQSAVRRFPLL